MTDRIVLHCVIPERPSRWVGQSPLLRRVGRFRPCVRAYDFIIHGVSGDAEVVRAACTGLSRGTARPEAVAVRLRRLGARVVWGSAHPLRTEDLLSFCWQRGYSSVEIARVDPSLLTELQVGSWFEADWRIRLARRVVCRLPLSALRIVGWGSIALAADFAFWRGVRAAASHSEWLRLTCSSHVALVYHRLAGEAKPGQERVDLPPRLFDRQMRFLRLLGFHHLRAQELLNFHQRRETILPRRAFIVSFDDAFLDCHASLLRYGAMQPQLFVSVKELGGRAHWLDYEPVMTWDHVRSLAAAGVAVGSHACRHRKLTCLPTEEVEIEVRESRAELAAKLIDPLEIIAYPNGDHDEAVRGATIAAGYRAAFTTGKGRNGAGTDPYLLRRVSVHSMDGALAILFKVVTGENLPSLWRLIRRVRRTLLSQALLRAALLSRRGRSS